MTIKEFKEDCISWMKELGYSESARSGDYSWIGFSHLEVGKGYPAINVYFNNGNPEVEVLETQPYKLFLSLRSGRLAYRHKDIQDWIDYFIKIFTWMSFGNDTGRIDRIKLN